MENMATEAPTHPRREGTLAPAGEFCTNDGIMVGDEEKPTGGTLLLGSEYPLAKLFVDPAFD